MYKRATDTLTEKLPDGTTRHLHGVDHNKNYGVMAYLLYTSYMNFQPRNEELASKYARIMHEQWDTYFFRAGRQVNTLLSFFKKRFRKKLFYKKLLKCKSHNSGTPQRNKTPLTCLVS
eukprot:sb/3476438/